MSRSPRFTSYLLYNSGFEECTYLLLFGSLPTKDELKEFTNMLSKYRTLPTSFVRDIIMKAPSRDMMNTLARSVLTLYSYDDRADDISLPNVLRQCLQLISLFPLLSVYGYQAYKHYHDGASLFIHPPKEEYSTAENILHILRADSKFTPLEAKLLDTALILHMEHGGGNNSTFTMHLVSSSGTDTYSAIAASLGSLKGPKHGGANIKVVKMFDDMKKQVKDWSNEDEIADYLTKLLHKEAFDHAGLIYGMGHAVGEAAVKVNVWTDTLVDLTFFCNDLRGKPLDRCIEFEFFFIALFFGEFFYERAENNSSWIGK